MRVLIAGLAILLFSGYGLAANAQPVEPRSFTFKLESVDDSQRDWEASSLAGVNTARAHVTFLRTTKGKDHFPTVLFTVGNLDLFATLELAVFPSGHMLGFVTLYKGDEKIAFASISKPPKFSKPFEIEIDWSKPGIINFLFLDENNNVLEKHEVNFDGAVEEFAITVTNGTVEVAPLTLIRKDAQGDIQRPT